MPDPVSWYSQSQSAYDFSNAGSVRFVARQSGYLRRVQIMLSGAITVAAEAFTVSVDNGTAVSVGSIPVAGSAEGTLLSKDFYMFVKAGSNVEVNNDGASTPGTTTATVQVTLSP